jgi:uncharacterized protein (TIGR03790 family)
MYQRLVLLIFCAAGALWICGCAGGGNTLTTIEREQPAFRLPELGALPAFGGGHSTMAAGPAEYNLLLVDPIDSSPAGALQDEGTLALDPAANGGMAWAIYALPGFPTDGSIVPTAISVDKGMPEVWIALSNYSSNAWEFKQFVFGGAVPLENGAELFSIAGVMYVAVIGAKTAVDVYSVEVTTSEELPGAPVAVINAPDRILVGFEATFDAVGSTSGDGAFSELVWTFDGGGQQTTDDPATEVTHTFPTAGSHTVGLTVKNDLARTGHTDLPVNVEAITWVKDLLIVYNSDMPDDLDLVEYYSSPLTGRSIDPAYRLGLPLGDSAAETISRDNYGAQIRNPIISFLDDPANSDIKANVKYLLMMKGVPHKIPGSNGGDHSLSTNACVDSELCLLRSGGVSSSEGYRIEGPIWDESEFYGFNKGGFYFADDLVCRITAYTYDDCKAMIDRSLAADTSQTGWIILDSKPGSLAYERMFDPVWPYSDNDHDSGFEILSDAGFNIVGDTTADRITADYPDLPADAADNMFVYCSWGVHSGFSMTYILDTLGFNYLPGACFMSYESFNATTMRCSNPGDPAEGHPSQGQIADFIRMGGTCAIGNVYEPWTDGVGDERWVFHRYMETGDRWIEAAYKGLCYVSWQEVVIGDPLCRVVAD